MDIETLAREKGERAEELFRSGYGCAQAVLLAFEKESGLNKEQLIKLGSPFGGGMGRMRLTCGAVTAAVMLSGLLCSNGNRAEDYERVQSIAAELTKINGSIICAELLKGVSVTSGSAPEQRDNEYYKRRPCPKLCNIAAFVTARHCLCEKTAEKN